VANRPLIPILCIAVRKLSGAVGLAAATAVLALVAPGISAAQTTAPKPNLTTLVAEAKQLEFQINALSEQYDGLRLQLTRAQANARIAQQAASRGSAALAVGQQAVAQLAAANYMNSGLDPTLAALTTGDPRQFLSQASAIAELDQSSGVKVSTLSSQVTQALRDKQTAGQQIAAVNALEAQMNAKKKIINGKIDKVNSAAMKQAMTVFEQTGHYPTVSIPTANTVGAQALQAAITKAGDPYVWGAAGPGQFDCSGLVVWAYAQEGVALHRQPVEFRRARGPQRSGAGRPGLLLLRHQPRRYLRRRRDDDRRPQLRRACACRADLLERLRRRRPDRLNGHLRLEDSAWPAFLS
jgi:cell wall-associated NlpC family hydrolase